MIYAEVKSDGVINQVWGNVEDPKFNPPLLAGSTLISFPDDSDVRPGMIWDGLQILPPPPPSLSEVQANAKMVIRDVAETFGRMLKTVDFTTGLTYPDAEVESWDEKLRVAREYSAGTATPEDLAILEEEIAITGETLDDLVQKILTNAKFYRIAVGRMTGLRRQAFKAVDAATTEADVQRALDNAKVAAEQMASELGFTLFPPEQA